MDSLVLNFDALSLHQDALTMMVSVRLPLRLQPLA